MSPQSIAALYGVATFAILAGWYSAAMHLAFGWPLIPQASRFQGTLMLAWYVVAGLFARAVGQHGAKGATLGEAWRAGLSDLGRGARSLVMR
ncbi:MAG: hypothetical protein EXR72_11430 [Myxococcales bacterium]|nr:hypothetical protein [Myxococcales bacterium]